MDTDEDDLEYHITFPSPGPSADDDTQELQKLDFSSLKKEPVIFLLGWAGSSDRHISKYSVIYEKNGCFTIRYVPRVKDMYQPDTRCVLRPVARKLVDLLHDLSLTNHPIIFHMFSNGGALVYRSIYDEMLFEQNLLKQVKGCIFDSAPAKTSLTLAFKSALRAVPGSCVMKYLTACSLFLYLGVKRLVEIFSCNWFTQKKRQMFRFGMWQDLVEDNTRCPQLFLFSKADDLCDYNSIQDFIDKRKDKGVDVTSVLWEDSPHVDHLRNHREEYMSNIMSFLSKCLLKK